MRLTMDSCAWALACPVRMAARGRSSPIFTRSSNAVRPEHPAPDRSCYPALKYVIGTGPGGDMTRTHDYQIINDTAPAIETALATRTADGWRPILMSTATVNTAVQVFIPSPYAK